MRSLTRCGVVSLGLLLPASAFGYVLFGDDWTWDPAPLSEPVLLNVSSFATTIGTSTEIQAALEGAMGVWNDEGAAEFSFTSGGTTTSTSWTDDGVFVLQYRDASYGGSTLARAQYFATSGDISDCDIRFYSRNGDGAIAWSAAETGPEAGEYDLEKVAIHELGHCLGLDHSSSSDAIMYPTTGAGTPVSDRALSSDDIAGIQAIYGPDCGDLDGDGYGKAEACGGDCDDLDSTRNPGVAEVCDGIDQDCDGVADDGFDVDGDGWRTCDGDCDDGAEGVHPGAAELCDGVDDDCDGAFVTGETTDGDGDGALACVDCDDTEPAALPGGSEVCDGVDNDCDGTADNEPSATYSVGSTGTGTARSASVYGNVYRMDEPRTLEAFSMYLRATSDASITVYVLEATSEAGDYAPVSTLATTLPASTGWVTFDALDVPLEADRHYALAVGVTSGSVYYYRDTTPDLAATGVFTPIGYTSQTTSGTISGALTADPSATALYAQELQLVGVEDADGDGLAALCGDCDDGDDTIHPGASERCDGEDDDCDGGLPASEDDADGDGTIACADCDDAEATIHPGATEACNRVDDDCDGALSAAETDGDGDGLASCEGDCDDADAAVGPDATEVCNGVDDDCDGTTDTSGALTSVSSTWGATSSSKSISGDTYGNVFSVAEDGVLHGFEAWLDPTGTVTATFQVYESTSRTGTYTRVASTSTSISGSAAWQDSGTLDVPLTAGRYYALMVGLSSTTIFYRESGPTLSESGYVTPWGYLYDSSSTAPASISTDPSSTYFFRERLDIGFAVDDLDDDGDGWTEFCGDCDDTSATLAPGITERCNGVDDDCSGAPDADEVDADADGAMVCEGDCDDTSALFGPAVAESCNGLDDDCSGAPDSTEVDGDGDGVMACDGDCDDTDPALGPDATEACDGIDNDCDGYVDASGAWTSVAATFGDTTSLTTVSSGLYGNVYQPATTMVLDSFAQWLDPSGTVTATFQVYEATTETGTYTRIGSASSSISGAAGWQVSPSLGVTLQAGRYYALAVGFSATTYVYRDATPDLATSARLTPLGYTYSGSATPSTLSMDPSTSTLCAQALTLESPPDVDVDDDADGLSEFCGDCDDANGAVLPGAAERCDGIDQDCDGGIDEDAADAAAWFADADGDGAGDPTTVMAACEASDGWVADGTDCDDTTADIGPGAPEHCDAVDEDCDGVVDEDAVDAPWWYPDTDADGYAGADGGVMACSAPIGSSAEASDCDDTRAGVFPGAGETCDGVDEDCDGLVDEDAADATVWYRDADGDGHGDADTVGFACAESAGWVATADDCDDSLASTFPGAMETWYDGLDGDCLGGDDFDADGDGHPSASWGGDDCDDADAAVYPGAPDTPYDGVVSDCAGADEFDQDGDGYLAEVGGGDDCDDAASDTHPYATEVWYDGVDQDCDGDDVDQDGDGWPVDTDCDDTDPALWPGAPGYDLDCAPIGPGDTAVVDTGPVDSGPVDTASGETGDTGVADTSLVDTGVADTSLVDTGVADTSPVDTGVADTSLVDTGVADTSPVDTGVVESGTEDTSPGDTGTGDTSPVDTGTVDTSPVDTGDTGTVDTSPVETAEGETDGGDSAADSPTDSSDGDSAGETGGPGVIPADSAGDTGVKSDAGCGCASASPRGPAGVVLLLLLGFGLRRRGPHG